MYSTQVLSHQGALLCLSHICHACIKPRRGREEAMWCHLHGPFNAQEGTGVVLNVVYVSKFIYTERIFAVISWGRVWSCFWFTCLPIQTPTVRQQQHLHYIIGKQTLSMKGSCFPHFMALWHKPHVHNIFCIETDKGWPVVLLIHECILQRQLGEKPWRILC